MKYRSNEPRPPENDEAVTGDRLEEQNEVPADEGDADTNGRPPKRKRIDYDDDELRGYPPRPRR